MPMQGRPSRRDFLSAVAVALAPHSMHSVTRNVQEPIVGASPTVQEAIDAILSRIPAESVPDTVDTVKSGDPARPLKGVATTFLATTEVIRRAQDRGANLLITHEPIFYNHRDEIDWLQEDPVYRYKRKLLEESGIVVWRFHDYQHRMKPDPVNQALLADLGLGEAETGGNNTTCEISPTPLGQLARTFKRRLDLPLVRIVGDPGLSCRRIGLLPGAWGGRAQIGLWSRERVDVLVCGEINEWETNIYIQDAISAGHQTGLIILGHVNTEEPGMRLLAEWLRPRFPGISVEHIPMGDPFQYL